MSNATNALSEATGESPLQIIANLGTRIRARHAKRAQHNPMNLRGYDSALQVARVAYQRVRDGKDCLYDALGAIAMHLPTDSDAASLHVTIGEYIEPARQAASRDRLLAGNYIVVAGKHAEHTARLDAQDESVLLEISSTRTRQRAYTAAAHGTRKPRSR